MTRKKSVRSVSSVAIRDSDREDAADQPDVTRPGDHRKNDTRKSYGAGAIRVEPRALETLPIPADLVESRSLLTERSQLALL